jgi:hypothetical protein
MLAAPHRTLFRILLAFLAAIVVFRVWEQRPTTKVTMAAADTLSQLKVSVRKSAPVAITFAVTNNHDSPLTVLRWDSPLDPSAIQLGVLQFFSPPDSSSPLDIPTIRVRRRVPPSQDSLVTLAPGQTVEQSLELKEPIVPVDQLKGEVKVACQGKWLCVWAKTADQLSSKELEELGVGEQALSGDISMEPLVLSF